MAANSTGERAREVPGRIRSILRGGAVALTFAASEETGHLRYFSARASEDISAGLRAPFRWLQFDDYLREEARIFIVTGHGSDQSEPLQELRAHEHPDTILAVWLWDNHISNVNNRRTALAADIVFPSHAYHSSYLANPLSILGPHIPACSAQWSRAEAARLFAAHGSGPRSGKLLVNYVDYEFSPRSALLRRLAADAPEADVMLMSADRRERYFAKSPAERFREWAAYKATVILPVERDLSTRVFDALLAGLVPIVPRTIQDFDLVVPPAVQESLGVVRIDAPSLESIREATLRAVRRFDALGPEGVAARHEYALRNHLLDNRVLAMAESIRQLAGGS